MVVRNKQQYFTVPKSTKIKACLEILILVALLMAVGGCATTQPPSAPPTVDVPVVVEVPEPPVFVLPVLPIHNLTESSKQHPDEVVKAFAATVELLKGEVKARDLALKPYRKAP